MTFRRRFAAIGVLFALGFVALFWVGHANISKVMVNGPIYQLLALDKDLISEILPPTEFIVEPYLVVCQMNGAKTAETLQTLAKELQSLEIKYR